MRVLRRGDAHSSLWEKHLTGTAWMDLLLQEETDDPDGNVTVTSTMFTPGSRSDWHSHSAGQLLLVVAGEGWIGDRVNPRQVIHVGDLVWTAAGEDHWHGATDDSVLTHIAITLGSTHWHDEPVDPIHTST